MNELRERARELAEGVLYPAAGEVDATGIIPESHFAALGNDGFYSLATPGEHGGPAIAFAEMTAIVETLAGACLATTFTWMQHHSAVRGLAGTSRVELRQHYLAAATRGELRCGVAFAGAIPQPPLLWATRVAGGYRLDGTAPLVTGWGIVQLLQVSARDAATADAADDDGATIVTALVDAEAAAGVRVHPLELLAANASNTVRLEIDGWFVPDERVIGCVSRAAFQAGMLASARINGCLALGITGRCARLITEAGQHELASSLAAEQDAARDELDAAVADRQRMPAARAAASELAVRAAGALVTAAGSAAIAGRHPAGRLVREAAFTLVAAGRPEIKAELIRRFAHR